MDLMKNEEIKVIDGFENYAVTTMGRVWSFRSNKFLKPTLNQRGNHKRFYVSLGRGNKKYIHQLVAQAFIPNPNNYTEVDHIDADGTNNNVENLRWVTHQENMENSQTKNNLKKNTGYYIEIEEIETGEIFVGIKEIMEKYKVSEQTVLNHLNEKVKNPRWRRTGNRIRPKEEK